MTLLPHTKPKTSQKVIVDVIIRELYENSYQGERFVPPSAADLMEGTWQEIEQHFSDESDAVKKELRDYATQLIQSAYEQEDRRESL